MDDGTAPTQNVFIVPTENNNVFSSSSAEDRKVHVDKLLAEREALRLAEFAARAEKREQEKANHENLDYFSKTFTQEYNSIVNQLEHLRNQTTATSSSSGGVASDENDLISHLQDLASKVELLQKYLNESTSFLPSRTITQFMAQISSLQNQIGQLKQQSVPKKKFAFKSKKAVALQPPTLAVNKITARDVKKQKSTEAEENQCEEKTTQKDILAPGIQNVTGEKNVTLAGKDVDGQDLIVENISNCRIRILGSPSTVHLLKVNNSQIMIGPVSTSVFLDKCHNSTIVFACQQLRCHSSSKCNLYVHITARGIIEDCNEIYFGPYTFEYHELEQHFKASNLTREVNNWKSIDDFNWLSKTETSPNFSFIPESQWKQFC